MASSICFSFRTIVPQRTHTNKNCLLLHCKMKNSLNFPPLSASSSFNNDSIPSTPNPKQPQVSYDLAEDLFGIYADLQPRNPKSTPIASRVTFRS